MGVKDMLIKIAVKMWPGASEEEIDEGVEQVRKDIEERDEARLKVEADIAIKKPTADDFDSWLGKPGGDSGADT